jgi:preprotein translocase subunit SecY
MIDSIKKILSVHELKEKIVFTLLMLIVCRIGAFIPVPGINSEEALKIFQFTAGGSQNLLQLASVFTGGAFSQMTVIALGVAPYITASIVMQMLVPLVPSIQREMKENSELAKRKMGKRTRVLTLGLALFQSFIYAKYAYYMNLSHPGIIVEPILHAQLFGVSWLFYAIAMVTMTTGTLFLMWIGEQITAKGIGNGVSMIIALGILSSFPTTLGSLLRGLNLDSQEAGQLTFSSLLFLVSIFVFVIVGTILVVQGQRKIPLQYARRLSGREDAAASNAYIPLKLNYAGVIPVILASTLLMFPASIAKFLGKGDALSGFASKLLPGSWVFTIAYVLLIIFFSYFWTSTQFHPEQIASDMKKNGAFIPGIKQGGPTQDYLQTTMNKITFAGSIFLAFIAVLPTLMGKALGIDSTITQFFGGTSLLILVGVVLDTTKQIESHLIMKRYDGFMKKGRISSGL